MSRLALLTLAAVLALSGDDAIEAGHYTGDWQSDGSGGSGSFRMDLEAKPDGTWHSSVTFTFAGADVETTIRTVKVEGSSIELAYDFQLQGNVLRSKTTGKWNGKSFEGRYRTTTADSSDSLDEGVWKAAPAH
jgi:hypothetical protein